MATVAREYSFSVTLSVVGHVALLAILGLRLISLPAPKVPHIPLAIEATVIDTGALRRREEQERQQRAAEQRRLAELEQQRQAAEAQRQAEAQRAADEQREAEEQRVRAEQARVAEQQRKEEAQRQAEAERKADEQRKAAEQRKRAEEARVAEQQRRAEAERQRQAAERQAQFQRELELEEQRLAAVASGKLDQYRRLVYERVYRNWARPGSATAGIECVVHVAQIPGGEVVNVRVGRCNGDASVVRSIVAAVEKSSPLPPPPDPSLFQRNLEILFKPSE